MKKNDVPSTEFSFSSNGIQTLPTDNSLNDNNELMTTLQSFNFQSMNTHFMNSNVSESLKNQRLLEQLQLQAIQNVYNTLGPSCSTNPIQTVFSNPGQKNVSFGNDHGNSDELSNMLHSKHEPSHVSTTIESCTDQLSNNAKNNIAGIFGLNDWTQPIHIGNAVNESTTTIPNFQQTVSLNFANDQTAEKIDNGFEKEQRKQDVMNSSIEESTPVKRLRLDYDEAHDDVENIFGLSLAESETQTNALFRQQNTAAEGLSPIEFTPPDSPHEEFTLDMLFGLQSHNLKPNDVSSDKVIETLDLTAADDSHLNKPSENLNVNTQSNSLNKKVPVYKQKSVLLSIEAQESARKEDPNYDAFEFEDEDDFGHTSNLKKDPIAALKQGTKTRSVYIPGQGFQMTSRERDQAAMSSKKQLVKSTQQINGGFAEQLICTIGDIIRERKDKEMTCSYLKIIQIPDNECAQNLKRLSVNTIRLPKLFIRKQCLQTRNNESEYLKRRNKKRKHIDDNDSDWEDASEKQRKTIKYKTSPFSDNTEQCHYSICETSFGPHCSNSVQKRLNMFGPAEGILPKGTYVVLKSDVLKEDCALWRVDNQNLLQKFPPYQELQTDKQIYKSSSIYSGWCEQISSQYFRVAVNIVKQNRSETTIEPEIPLQDLFPASATELFKTPLSVNVKEQNNSSEKECSIANNTSKVALHTLINAHLHQAITSTYIENLLHENDWTYSRALKEIQDINKKFKNRIMQRIPVKTKHRKWIKLYTRVAVSRTSFYSLTKCQICEKKKPRRVIHFFDRSSYDKKTLVVQHGSYDNKEKIGTEPAVDAISCGRCALAIEFLHTMRHMQLYLLRICEEKLEEIGTTEFDISSEKIVDVAISDEKWNLEIVEKFLNLWDQIHFNFRVS